MKHQEDLEKDCRSFLSKLNDEQLIQYLSPYARRHLNNNEPFAEWYVRYQRDGSCDSKELEEYLKTHDA